MTLWQVLGLGNFRLEGRQAHLGAQFVGLRKLGFQVGDAVARQHVFQFLGQMLDQFGLTAPVVIGVFLTVQLTTDVGQQPRNDAVVTVALLGLHAHFWHG